MVYNVSMSLKDKLKELRATKGWTQSDLAKSAKVPFRSVQNWEYGIREPRLAALKSLAKALGVTVDELLAPDKKH
jgi:transcriptional regulator with XRE-family HTH domain